MKTALGLIAFLGLATATGAIATDAPTPIGYVTKASTNQGWAIINKGSSADPLPGALSKIRSMRSGLSSPKA